MSIPIVGYDAKTLQWERASDKGWTGSMVWDRPEAGAKLYPSDPANDVSIQRSFDPQLWLMHARRGGGKSLASTCLGWFWHEAFKAKHTGQRVMANYMLKYTQYAGAIGTQSVGVCDGDAYHVHDRSCYEALPVPACHEDHPYRLMDMPKWARRRYIIVDEVADVVNALRSNARETRDFVGFIRQIRKLDSELLMNTQKINRVAQALLEQIDTFVKVEGHIFDRNEIDLLCYDFTNDGKYADKRVPTDGQHPDKVITIGNVRSMFGQYNTRHIVAPIYRRSVASWQKTNWHEGVA